MKTKFCLLGVVMALTFVVNAQVADGTSCETAFTFEDRYEGVLGDGDYWFTAQTMDLPLTIYYYPTEPELQAPEIYLDLTCTAGVYDDPNVERMVSLAENYHLTFPLSQEMKFYEVEGRVVYITSFDEDYREMLRKEGVTYSIPAYVRLRSYGSSTVQIVSTSVNSVCKDYTNSFSMNTSLLYAPEDSVNVYLWPIGEWIKSTYNVLWEGDEPLEIFAETDCKVSRTHASRKFTVTKDAGIRMTPYNTSDWINDDKVWQTYVYARLYAKKEGVLSFAEEVNETRLISVKVFGVPVPIDFENNKITIWQPFDNETKKPKVRSVCVAATEFEYVAPKGVEPYWEAPRYTTLTLGDVQYEVDWKNDVKSDVSVDASLKWIRLGGDELEGFEASRLVYKDVEVESLPEVSAEANDENAKVSIRQATAVPGTAKVIVIAEAENQQTYELNFINVRSKDATLKGIYLDGKLIDNFNPENVSYRIAVKSVPTVTVELNDEKSTYTIQQAKQVPGYAQIEVVAEAGNKLVYTVNMQPDNSAENCLLEQNAHRIDVGETFAIEAQDESVFRVPVSQWDSEKMRIRFAFDKSSDVKMILSSSCFIDNSTKIGEYKLTPEKGTQIAKLDLRAEDIHEWNKKAVNDNVYVQFVSSEDGEITISNWDEDCLTQSTLLNFRGRYELNSYSFAQSYKLYVPDWQGKDAQIAWTGSATLKMYVADACEFYLQDNNVHVHDILNFKADSDTLDIAQSRPDSWLQFADQDFVYVRFVTGGNGWVRTLLKGDPADGLKEVKNTEFTAEALGNGKVKVAGLQQANVRVFNMLGEMVSGFVLLNGEERTVDLGQGMYIVCTDNFSKKIVVK